MPHPYFETLGPMILGHRGAAGCAPENTLLSFARALEQGAQAIESDVQITADGVPMLMHDSHVGRTTNGRGAVEELTRAEIEKLDAGHHFTIEERGTTEPETDTAFRGQGLHVPSLEEAFQAFPEARFNLEIKTAANAAVTRVVELVAKLGREDRTLLTAGNGEIMQSLREALARHSVHAATSASVPDVVAVVRSALEGSPPPAAVEALQIPSRFADRDLVTEALLSHCQKHAIQVHVWTINEGSEMKRLLELGVDGLITDFPGRLVQLLAA
jgi:glycerophosphoryl diester phosphodiesterase